MPREQNPTFKSRNLHYAFNEEYYHKMLNELENNQDKKTKDMKSINEALIKHSVNMYPNVKYSDYVLQEVGNCKFRLTTQYPGLLAGIGYTHESKDKSIKGEIQLGFSFDYVTGMPYIPGSTVKGVLRNAFQYTSYISKELGIEGVEEQQVEQLEKAIFEGISCEDKIKMQDRDIFFDAIICSESEKILKLDNITPHEMSADKKFQEPNPITMLKVGPKVEFEFRFQLFETKLNDAITITPEKKIELFQKIIEEFGIGAKNNVGYGVLCPE